MANSAYCNPAPDFLVSERCVDEPGGIIAAGYIKSGVTFADYEDNAEWTAKIASSDVLIVYDTRGEYGGATVNATDDTYGDGADQEFQSFSHQVTYEHKGIHIGTSGARDNITGYNALAKLSGAYSFWWVDSGKKLWIGNGLVSVQPKSLIPKSKKEQEFWQVVVGWTDQDLVQTYDAPAITYLAP